MIEITFIQECHDKYDTSKKYHIGDKLVLDEVARINNIVKCGLGEITSVNMPVLPQEGDVVAKVKFEDKEYDTKTMIAALKQLSGVSVAYNAGADNLTEKIAALTDDQKKSLSEILNKE